MLGESSAARASWLSVPPSCATAASSVSARSTVRVPFPPSLADEDFTVEWKALSSRRKVVVGTAGGQDQRSTGASRVRRAAPTEAITTSAIPSTARAASPCPSTMKPGQRGHRRLDAHQHAEHGRIDPPQRLVLERVGDGRGQQPDGGAEQERAGLEQVRAALGDAERDHHHAGHAHGQRQPGSALERPARPAR